MIDMHFHSKYSSDGRDTPERHVKKAKERGARLVSLTDHHNLDGQEEARTAALNLGMQYVNGVEMAGLVRVEAHEFKVHILAYDFGNECPGIRALCDRVQAFREIQVSGIVKGLWRRGIPIKPDMFAEPVGASKIKKWLRAGGWCEDDKEAANRLIELAFEEGNNDRALDRPQIPDARTTIEAIRADGGMSFFAHPFMNPEKKGGTEVVWSIIEKMVELGVDGIEIVNKSNDGGMANHLFDYCVERGLPGTGGTDSHGCEGTGSAFIPIAFYESLCNLRAGRPAWYASSRSRCDADEKRRQV